MELFLLYEKSELPWSLGLHHQIDNRCEQFPRDFMLFGRSGRTKARPEDVDHSPKEDSLHLSKVGRGAQIEVIGTGGDDVRRVRID
jgi:hypothetical protein